MCERRGSYIFLNIYSIELLQAELSRVKYFHVLQNECTQSLIDS